jgi:hypothetical protein
MLRDIMDRGEDLLKQEPYMNDALRDGEAEEKDET